MINLSRVKAFIEAFKQYSNVVEVFLNTSSVLCFIWGPMKFCLQVASSWAESFDTLLDAYQQLAENIPLLEQYGDLFKGNSYMVNVLALFYEDMLDFHRAALRVFSKSTRHKALVESQATILQFEKQQKDYTKAETSLSTIQESILRIQEYQRKHLNHKKQFEAIEKEDNKCQRLALLDWLASTDPIPDHEFAVSMRADYPSSGNWILQENKIKAWLDPQQSTVPLLWINGIPGAEKIQQKFVVPDDTKTYIIKAVSEGADEMFLYAKLILTNLYGQTSREKLYEELRPGTFPVGFEQAYSRIVSLVYQNPNELERATAEKLLGWISCAKRPMRWPEIQAAVSINIDDEDVNFEDRQLRAHIQDLCGSLVEVLPGDRVQLVHSTAKSYLIDKSHVKIILEEQKLAVMCLRYLLFQCFDPTTPDNQIHRYVNEGYYAFQEYAIVYWVDHLESLVEQLSPSDLENSEQCDLGSAIAEFYEIFEVQSTKRSDTRRQ
ncbi:hypothetical protein BCON_0473g00060 [Botryotinia convoluta]|uniref:Uncharacterized protein n=1 Tax=Botryotinia convoluta TaxID=54673 RepID=A0A4Z1H7R4_9HELO|nr:hypothetical protein BCON_0473g00060 [Botryotinia convoluta]